MVWCVDVFSDVEEFNFDWKINNFKKAMKARGKVESPPLSIPGSDGVVCYVVCTRINPGFAVTKIQFEQAEKTMKDAELFTVTLEFEGKEGKVVYLAGNVQVLCDVDTWCSGKFGDKTKDEFEGSTPFSGSRYGWKLNQRQEFYFWGSNNTRGSYSGFWHNSESNKPLHIKMKVHSPGEIRRISSQSFKPVPDETLTLSSELKVCMKKLLLDPNYSDVTLQCQDKAFKCHKVILGACSPVLNNMFETDMKESNTGLLEIVDFEPDVVEAMIEHVYTNEVTKVVTDLDQLLYIGDKYDLRGLVDYCFREFCSRLDDDHLVVNMLVAADKLDKPKLKDLAMQKILHEKTKFQSDEYFIQKVKSSPELLVELWKA